MISYSEKSSLVNWSAFEIKSDDKTRDFEALCRSLVRLAFSGDGDFIGYKQQAGVEFLLVVERENCVLGGSNTVVGWQCKYFRGEKLSPSQFAKIEDSYKKTLKYYPKVSKWVVWTPECLSKSDQEKIRRLRAKNHTVKQILFWHDDMILALSAILPRTSFLQSYFGQYSFSRKDLNEALVDSIVPVRGRWKEKVHYVTKAEVLVRRALFETEFWDDAWKISETLKQLNAKLGACKNVKGLRDLINKSRKCEEQYEELLDALKNGYQVDMQITDISAPIINQIPIVLHKAYSMRNKAHFLLVNLLHYAKRLSKLLDEMKQLLDDPIVAVAGAPGMGKTHLSISVVFPTERRPAGIFFQGRSLRKGRSIDELVRSQSFAGRTFENLDILLNALDSAGRKNGCIMPLVIDGLNEAESPADWLDTIELLRTKIKRNYRNVKVVVTFRCVGITTSKQKKYRHQLSDSKCFELDYERMCLPSGVKVIKIETESLNEMAKRYFELYEIDFKGHRLELRNTMINDPLLLSIFCDVNQGRSVVESDLKNSYNVLLDWLKVIKTRVCDGVGGRGFLSQREFEEAIDIFAMLLWTSSARSVSAEALDAKMRCTDWDWLRKWSTILSDEGLLMRYHIFGSSAVLIEGIHDQVSGFLIARYLKSHYENFQNIFRDSVVKKHPLMTDIITAIVPMWMEMYPNEDVVSAISMDDLSLIARCILSAGKKRCPLKTMKSLWELKGVKEEILYAAVWQCMDGENAFNGVVLDYYLHNLSMAERDALWGVWVYKMAEFIYDHLKFVYANRDKILLKDVQSVFTCCKWLSSSNVPPIRDLSTRIMCLIGEKYPEVILKFIVESFDVNDLYVLERLVASGYGICIYLKGVGGKGEFNELILKYANDLTNKILKKNAPYTTSHYGILNYAINTCALATSNKIRKIKVYANPFKSSDGVSVEDLDKSSFATRGDVDFVYKDLVHLVGGYDYQTDTSEYRKAFKLVKSRIFKLGYRNNLFEQYDRDIIDRRYRMLRSKDLFVRRFGKKYATIAFMELKGYRDKEVLCWDRWHEVSIDPTFPEPPLEFPSNSALLIKDKYRDMRQWIYGGFIPNVSQFMKCKYLEECVSEEFVLVDGYVSEEDKTGRRIFILMDGLLIPNDSLDAVKKSYCDVRIHRREFYYSFHGESPWSLNWYAVGEGGDGSRVALKPELVGDGGFVNHHGDNIPVELLTVRYNWESYHSVQNDVGGWLLTPKMVQSLGLRLLSHKWEYVDKKGRLAARYYSSQTSDQSIDLFYVRKDLLLRYAKMRKMVFMVGFWGERQINYKEHDKYKSIYKNWQSGNDRFDGFIDPIND